MKGWTASVPPVRAALGAIATCLALSGASVPRADTLAAAPETWRPPDPEVLEQLVARLESWLDEDGTLPPRRPGPAIRFVSPQEADMLHGAESARYLHGPLNGLYSAETQTVYLVAPWDYGNMRDVSVLLHELIHHRQQTARHWFCEAAQEEGAYRLQEKWLGSMGIESDFYWPAIILMSSCTPRDIHPK